MGDRANIVVRDDMTDDRAVFLYSHWGGYEMPETLRQALASPAGRGRWDDPAYLARIIFDTMIGGNQGGETGFGIGASMPDNEHDLLVLHNERIYRLPASDYHEHGFAGLPDCDSISFEDYVQATSRTWEDLTAPA